MSSPVENDGLLAKPSTFRSSGAWSSPEGPQRSEASEVEEPRSGLTPRWGRSPRGVAARVKGQLEYLFYHMSGETGANA